MKNILRAIVPVALGLAAAFGVSALPASASTQFTAHVQAPNRILTSQHLFKNEVLHVGLDGQAVRVTAVQDNGGGTVAWVSPFLVRVHPGQVIVLSA